ERKVLFVAIGFIGLLLLTALFMGSGLPKFQLAVVAGFLGVVAWVLGTSEKTKARVEEAKKEKETVAARKPEKVEGLLHVDPMELEVGVGLVRLIDPAQGGGFLDRVTQIRRQMAVDLGLVVPPVRILDNLKLEPNQYSIKIRGTTIASGTIRPAMWLAMDSGAASGPLEGEKTKEPAFGLAAYWVAEEQKARAEAQGY